MTKANKEITVSKDFEEALAIEWQGYVDRGAATVDALEDNTQELAFAKGFYQGVKWQEQKDTELLQEAGIVIVPEDHFERMKRSLIQLASQIKNLWKPADGDDLPETDREVVVLVKAFPDDEHSLLKVSFGHRPPEYWDGKNILTGEVTRHYTKRYDKGGWNIPDVVYWLDCKLPYEE